MKKVSSTLFLLALVIATCTLTSCNSKLDKIKQEIYETKKNMPISLGSIGSMTSIDLNEETKELLFTYLIETDNINPQSMRAHPETVKKSLMYSADMNKDVSYLLSECSEAGLTAAFKYAFDDGSTPVKVTITPQELKTMTHMTEQEARMAYLETNVEMTKYGLPMQTDELTIWKDMKLNNKYVSYIYEIDEQYITISDVKTVSSQFRDEIKQNLKKDDLALQELLKVCKKANIGLKYIYTGNITGEKLTLTFESYEL